MPFRSIRRHWSPFGEIFEKVRGPEKGSSLLITRSGKRLLLDFRRLLKSVSITPGMPYSNVVFSHGLNPKFIGVGNHAQVFLFSSEQENSFRQRSLFSAKPVLPAAVIKVYHQNMPEGARLNGFGQFAAETAIYNFFKKQRALPFSIRPLSYFFVSEKLTVRRFIRAPTIEELQQALRPKASRRVPLSLALSDAEIDDFVKRFGVTESSIRQLLSHIGAVASEGSRINFNFNPEMPIRTDLVTRNIFFLGRDSRGKPIVSIIDQGKRPLHGIMEKILQGKLF